jgi:hypothetical protein
MKKYFKFINHVLGMGLVLLFLFSMFVFGAKVFASDSINIGWTPVQADADGSRLYALECEGTWSESLTNATCDGQLVPTLLTTRSVIGKTTCSEYFTGMEGTNCYRFVQDNYFTDKEGKFCFGATAFRGEEESDYSPISCTVIAKLPPPLIPAMQLKILLTCDPVCTVKIVE